MQTPTIIVPIGLRGEAERVVPLAAAIADATDASMEMVHVVSSLDAPPPQERRRAWMARGAAPPPAAAAARAPTALRFFCGGGTTGRSPPSPPSESSSEEAAVRSTTPARAAHIILSRKPCDMMAGQLYAS